MGAKYGLKYRKRGEQTALRSYALRLTRGGTLQITIPRYIVKKLELIAGDRLRFEPKEHKCFLRKETDKTLPADRSFAVERAESHKKDETSGPFFNLKKLRQGPISRQGRERLLAEWQSNLTAQALAANLGVSLATISNWTRRYGLHYKSAKKLKQERLLTKWRSDLTAVALSRWLGVSLSTIYEWAEKYNLGYDRRGKLSRRNFVLQEEGQRGYEINVPQYVVNKMNLKAGDRIRFELKKNNCILSKER